MDENTIQAAESVARECGAIKNRIKGIDIAPLFAEIDRIKSEMVNVLSRGDRVELIPVKDGVKVVRVRREEVKKNAGLFPAELVPPEIIFPCYTCKHKGEETPRCENYNKCGLWLDWAKKKGLKK